MTKEVKEEITKDFLKIFRNSIKIKSGNSIFYLYDKEFIFKYKIFVLKDKPFNLNKFKNIEWGDNLVIFEQDIKNKDFWVKYEKYWRKLYTNYGLKYNEIKELIKGILDTHTNCKQYTTIIIHT